MHRGPVLFCAFGECPRMRVQTGVGRQQGGMDVQNSALKGRAGLRGEHSHIASQRNQVGVTSMQCRAQPRLVLVPRRAGRRVNNLGLKPLLTSPNEAGSIWLVADDAHNIHRQFGPMKMLHDRPQVASATRDENDQPLVHAPFILRSFGRLMRIRRGIPRPSATEHRGRVVTIGSFDGLHLGHWALVERSLMLANESGLLSSLLCFHPHPRAYFSPKEAPGRIQPLRDRLALLADAGLGEVHILPFGEALAITTAESFVRDILVGALGARHVVIGAGFRFGAKRQGDVNLLRELGASLNLQVHSIDPVEHAGERISSSRVRAALGAGDMLTVRALLGRPYALSGRVAHGQKLGRTLGFPTLNLRMPEDLLASGIFAVRVYGLSSSPQPGVASLGRRPTVEHQGQLLLEVHLFDWQEDVYGQRVCVDLHQFLRPEAQYDSVSALTDQMHLDLSHARAALLA